MGVIRISRLQNFGCSLVALLVSAGLLYVTYRAIFWVLDGDPHYFALAGVVGLVAGSWGLQCLAGTIGLMFAAVTGRELPQEPVPNTGTREHLSSGGTSVGAEFDEGDWGDE